MMVTLKPDDIAALDSQKMIRVDLDEGSSSNSNTKSNDVNTSTTGNSMAISDTDIDIDMDSEEEEELHLESGPAGTHVTGHIWSKGGSEVDVLEDDASLAFELSLTGGLDLNKDIQDNQVDVNKDNNDDSDSTATRDNADYDAYDTLENEDVEDRESKKNDHGNDNDKCDDNKHGEENEEDSQLSPAWDGDVTSEEAENAIARTFSQEQRPKHLPPPSSGLSGSLEGASSRDEDRENIDGGFYLSSN